MLGSSLLDGDGEGEDGLSDGGIHHHCLWQVELLKLLQEGQPVMCLIGDGASLC